MTNAGEKQRFLVSFMVDARGGAMRGCRHSGVRVIIPPRKAAQPTRITCRYLRKDRLTYAPPLMEGEALASRILECGPTGAKFLGPVILEVPHFASLRGREREIIILRSDNGETWREHTLEATEHAVQDVLNDSFDGEELRQLEDLNTSRITRILTTDFPQYFAIITRVRQEINAMGPDGGTVTSTVVPQVQALFQPGALTKKIRVGLQAQPVDPGLTAKLLGNSVAVSAIVTVEPRRRKFHKPITLTVPLPQAANKGMINQYSGEDPTLRLLCSITGGTTRAQWEDVTGSTPLTYLNDCVSFTTTVSARFWLIHSTNITDATKMATELYREVINVPYMAKFCVFAKRHLPEEARLRVFCMTDDREDKTLECQEHFEEVAKSRDVEVFEGKTQNLEFAGNLIPVTKSGEQLSFKFNAFCENRLPFVVRVKDPHAESVGRIAFMRQKKLSRSDPPQSPICNLNISLPENIVPEVTPSQPNLMALDKYNLLSLSQPDTIHKADLHLSDISNMLGKDWLPLAKELHVSSSDIGIIEAEYEHNLAQQALVMLRLWMQTAEHKATGNTLEAALRRTGRDDIIQRCIYNLEPVTDRTERERARAICDGADDDGAHLDDNQRTYPDNKKVIPESMSPTYEREERKYAAEEKTVIEEDNEQSQISEKLVLDFMKETEGDFDDNFKRVIGDIRERAHEDELLPSERSVEETCIESRKYSSEGEHHSGVITNVTERNSFIVDDGTVHERIVVERRLDHQLSPSDPVAKSEMLQKLGRELGELDARVHDKHQTKTHVEHHSVTEAGADTDNQSQTSVEDVMNVAVRETSSIVTPYQVVNSATELCNPAENMYKSGDTATITHQNESSIDEVPPVQKEVAFERSIEKHETELLEGQLKEHVVLCGNVTDQNSKSSCIAVGGAPEYAEKLTKELDLGAADIVLLETDGSDTENNLSNKFSNRDLSEAQPARETIESDGKDFLAENPALKLSSDIQSQSKLISEGGSGQVTLALEGTVNEKADLVTIVGTITEPGMGSENSVYISEQKSDGIFGEFSEAPSGTVSVTEENLEDNHLKEVIDILVVSQPPIVLQQETDTKSLIGAEVVEPSVESDIDIPVVSQLPNVLHQEADKKNLIVAEVVEPSVESDIDIPVVSQLSNVLHQEADKKNLIEAEVVEPSVESDIDMSEYEVLDTAEAGLTEVVPTINTLSSEVTETNPEIISELVSPQPGDMHAGQVDQVCGSKPASELDDPSTSVNGHERSLNLCEAPMSSGHLSQSFTKEHELKIDQEVQVLFGENSNVQASEHVNEVEKEAAAKKPAEKQDGICHKLEVHIKGDATVLSSTEKISEQEKVTESVEETIPQISEAMREARIDDNRDKKLLEKVETPEAETNYESEDRTSVNETFEVTHRTEHAERHGKHETSEASTDASAPSGEEEKK